jgi:hypothetical protein
MQKDVVDVHTATKSSDVTLLIDIVINRTETQLNRIEELYKDGDEGLGLKPNKTDLKQQLKKTQSSAVGGSNNYSKLLRHCLENPRRLEADFLFEAMDGMGT